ncbi:MAG: hypothetical protein QOD99_163 [Chthoniobacter sp.]|jgi:molecular chaperone GrpE (heat shock protein)|nr:hypothetical protein [Chthoniobacter sp.]
MSLTTAPAADPNFDIQMRSLTAEAEHRRDDRGEHRMQINFLEMLRPLVLGIEALGRTMTETTLVLERLENATDGIREMPAVMATVQETLNQKNGLNQKLFDALHDELRSYKDGFLLEVFHRPIVRDLVMLFDDLSALHRQTDAGLAHAEAESAPTNAQLRTFNTNLDHIIHSLLEILARMEVHRVDPLPGKLDKKMQRAVSVELADTKEEDHSIAASVKPGFMWRERLLRPEEVIVKKWKEGSLIALPTSSQK